MAGQRAKGRVGAEHHIKGGAGEGLRDCLQRSCGGAVPVDLVVDLCPVCHNEALEGRFAAEPSAGPLLTGDHGNVRGGVVRCHGRRHAGAHSLSKRRQEVLADEGIWQPGGATVVAGPGGLVPETVPCHQMPGCQACNTVPQIQLILRSSTAGHTGATCAG